MTTPQIIAPGEARQPVACVKFSDGPHASITSAKDAAQEQRWIDLVMAPLAERLRGRRCLDLACHKGALSWPLLAYGANSVTGVEFRRETVEEGARLFSVTPNKDRMRFVCADVFDFVSTCQPGEYDVILCCGFLYHTVRQAEFFREMKRLAPKILIVETSVAENFLWFGRKSFGKPPALFVYVDDPSLARDTAGPDGLVYWPTPSYIEFAARAAGFEPRRIKGANRHGFKHRMSWVCERS
ncbi:MAG TPA: class I SAM-dependent methyltransferase [Parvularculaceae bacterium]|nr:class I SAM-dependent methyltransferase [Parvularculaceae bacterium]